MATVKQRKAAELMVENGGVASRAMIDAGYSKATATEPSKLTQSKGFLELCDELGLTDNFLLETLVHDTKVLKPKERLGHLSLGAKMRGRLKDRLDVTTDGKSLVQHPLLNDASTHVPDNNSYSKDTDSQETP